MGKTARGKRDGTGPHKDSYQRQNNRTGKRQQSGQPCPNKRSTP